MKPVYSVVSQEDYDGASLPMPAPVWDESRRLSGLGRIGTQVTVLRQLRIRVMSRRDLSMISTRPPIRTSSSLLFHS
jgi:hypothetical protein